MNISCLIFGTLFVTFGLMFSLGKIHSHITPWKAMNDDEKAIIKIKPLCHNIGFMIILCGGIFLTGGVWSFFKAHLFVWCMIVWLILSGIDVCWIEKSQRYRRKKEVQTNE